MNERAHRIEPAPLAGGLILIVFGALFLADRLEMADFGDLISRHWPLIIVAVGVTHLASRDTIWNGLWLIVLGTWLQIAHLGVFGMTYRNSWPLLLIVLGVGIVGRAFFDAIGGDERSTR